MFQGFTMACARLTAREYRYGQGSALGARYDQPMQDAQRVVNGRLPSLSRHGSSSSCKRSQIT
jgi:hypothetical protein